MHSVKKKKAGWSVLFAASALLVGCAMPADEGIDEEGASGGVEGIEESLVTTNGLKTINGLTTSNGLTAVNGLRTYNGLRTRNGLSETVGLMTSSAGRDTVAYLVRCALRSDQSITKLDQNGASYTFTGQIGIAPEWADGVCDLNCQESVSACLLAHVNTSGEHISLWLDGNMPNVGWGQSTAHPYQEGSFFGNLFVDNPQAYYCNGEDFASGVVPGRLGATQTNAPYINAFYWGTGLCKTYCTPQDIPNEKDGYKACNGFNHVMTVWRNFDAAVSYKICNKANSKCLDSAGSTTEGGAIVQKSYTGATSQKWNVVQVNAKQYKLVNVSSKKVLDIYQKKTTDGTVVIQTTYSGASNQLWSLNSLADGSGFYKIQTVLNATSSLNVPTSYVSTEGKQLQEWTWNNNDTMKWSITLAN